MGWHPKRVAVVGPCVVIPSGGRFAVLDQGNGSIILAASFRTKDAAQKWIDRHEKKGTDR